MDEIFKRLAAEIRSGRKRAGLTQEQLAAAIDVTPESVSHFERGKIRPSLETVAALSGAIPVDFGRVFAPLKDNSTRTRLEAELNEEVTDLNDRELRTIIKMVGVLRETRR